eukprot:scaffold4690_cov116-Cylindrotheca_fusiformis.AAC.10
MVGRVVVLLQCWLWGTSGFVVHHPSKVSFLAHAPAWSTKMWLEKRGPSDATEDGWWNEEKRASYSVEESQLSRRKYSKRVTTETPIPQYPKKEAPQPVESAPSSIGDSLETSITEPSFTSTTEEGWWNEEKISSYGSQERHRTYAPYKADNIEAHSAPGSLPANTGWWSQNGKPRDFLDPENVREQRNTPSQLDVAAPTSGTSSSNSEQGQRQVSPALEAPSNAKETTGTMESSKSSTFLPATSKDKEDISKTTEAMTDKSTSEPSPPKEPALDTSIKGTTVTESMGDEAIAAYDPAMYMPPAPPKVKLGGAEARKRTNDKEASETANSPKVPAVDASTNKSTPTELKGEEEKSSFDDTLYTPPSASTHQKKGAPHEIESMNKENSPFEASPPEEEILLKTSENGWWNEERRDFFRPRQRLPQYTIRNLEMHRAPDNSADIDFWSGHVHPSDPSSSNTVPATGTTSPYLPASYQPQEESSGISNDKETSSPYLPASYQPQENPASMSQQRSSSPTACTENGWWNEEKKQTYSTIPMNRKYESHKLIPPDMDEATIRLMS